MSISETYAHCSHPTTALQMPPVFRRFSKSISREKRTVYVLLLFVVVLLTFFSPSSNKFVPFFSNGFVQLHGKIHPTKRQSSFVCMSPWKVLLAVRASQPLFNVKLYGFGGFPNSINSPDSTDTSSGVVRIELINYSLLQYWTLSNETIMLSLGSIYASSKNIFPPEGGSQDAHRDGWHQASGEAGLTVSFIIWRWNNDLLALFLPLPWQYSVKRSHPALEKLLWCLTELKNVRRTVVMWWFRC